MKPEIQKQITQYNAEVLNKLFPDKNFIFINKSSKPCTQDKDRLRQPWTCDCDDCLKEDRAYDAYLDAKFERQDENEGSED